MEILIFEKKVSSVIKKSLHLDCQRVCLSKVNLCFGRSKPMVWLEKTHGLVGVNLWLCRSKPMVCSMTDDIFF